MGRLDERMATVDAARQALSDEEFETPIRVM